MATMLELLRVHGPAGPAFWRFGREGRQNLWDAIGDPRPDAFLARRAGDARRHQVREAVEREAQRPACGDCGQKFTDDRWKDSTAVEWDHGDSPCICATTASAGHSKESSRHEWTSASAGRIARGRRRRPPTRRSAAGSDEDL
ncbi:hypothetical protein [Streptomyces sp. NBC_00459]|uniref:hypothetical protein n=1 Tax=Streptomyces sp. NBC_00459 TaxID=2975749 RepID=UPI002E188000